MDISGWKEPQIFSGRFEYWFRLQALREAADIKGVEPPKIGSLGLTKQILNSEGISGRGCQLDHNGPKVIYTKYFKQWLYSLASTIDCRCLAYFDQKSTFCIFLSKKIWKDTPV